MLSLLPSSAGLAASEPGTWKTKQLLKKAGTITVEPLQMTVQIKFLHKIKEMTENPECLLHENSIQQQCPQK